MRDPRGTLEPETRTWVDEGLITDEQREAILARYPRADHRRRQAAILSILGAVLVGVGAILFVATNWEAIPRTARFVLLVGATGLAHGAGLHLRRTGASPHVGHALHVVGSFLFGATLFLVAQLYNVNANAPTLLLLWAIGVLPLAWALPSRPTLLLGLGVTGLWLGFQAFDWLRFAGEDDLFVPAAVTVPFLAFGVLLWAVGRLHASLPRLQEVTEFAPWFGALGLTLMAAGLYAFTFDLGDVPAGSDGVVAPLAALTAVFLVTGLGALGLWAVRQANRLAWAELAAVGAVVLAALLVYLVPAVVVHPLPYNLVLAGLILGTVLLGVQRGDEVLINLGLLFFVVDVVTRYFDLFFDMLDRSLFFIVGGLLLIAGGWLLERQRRHMVARARGGEAS